MNEKRQGNKCANLHTAISRNSHTFKFVVLFEIWFENTDSQYTSIILARYQHFLNFVIQDNSETITSPV